MRRHPALLPLLLLALLPAAASAQANDPLKSPACAEALASLQEARSSGKGVEAARDKAAGTCLGSTELPKRPSRVVQAPIAVPGPVITPPTASLPAAPLTAPAPPPPVDVPHAPMPAHCDGGGCWTNNGTHQQLLPPNLTTPHGACVTQGGLLYCP
jgi:hypothetical protein